MFMKNLHADKLLFASIFVCLLFACSSPQSIKPLDTSHANFCIQQFKKIQGSVGSMSLKEFDQTPAGGWRLLEDQGCYTEAADLIGVYQLNSNHSESQLFFHAGQLFAAAGNYAVAIEKLQKSIYPDSVDLNGFLWNDYVRGTIAFLNRDYDLLTKFRDKLFGGDAEKNRANLRILNSLLQKFDLPYVQASRPTSLPNQSKGPGAIVF